ncbi:MAG: hypothetical protein EBZ24_12320 [Synechococcaceae bacterium WB9_4xB_025]|jgi:hypothetical protein|nr:hypothetical protein [Synechococcaceae bacterium WB9_4xB_025]
MGDIELTSEQKYMLRRVEMEANAMSKAELVQALCTSWEARFKLKQTFLTNSRAAGFIFFLEERHPWQPPETEEEFASLMGYVPTEDEANEYLRELHEVATMELDMDDIVLTPDDDSEM